LKKIIISNDVTFDRERVWKWKINDVNSRGDPIKINLEADQVNRQNDHDDKDAEQNQAEIEEVNDAGTVKQPRRSTIVRRPYQRLNDFKIFRDSVKGEDENLLQLILMVEDEPVTLNQALESSQ